jgi:MGT family glycosyltransferase
MQVFLDESIAVLPRLLESDRPDAVLYDIGGLAGRVAANRWGVPATQLSPTYVAWEGYEEDMAEFASALKESPSGRHYYATLRAWLDVNDIALDADAFLGRPEACVALIPRVIQPNEERVSDRYVFAGPCIDETRTSGWRPAPGDDRPLVYVSFGTAYTDAAELYQRIVEELQPTYRLVLATGKVDPSTLPAGVEAARAQPQLDVLKHADVFITHAGMGGTVESLWFGVPTVAIPQAVDQFTNAAQLEAIGAGVQLGERGLRDAVAAALERTPRAHELREQVRANGGPDKAADAVERLCRYSPSAARR